MLAWHIHWKVGEKNCMYYVYVIYVPYISKRSGGLKPYICETHFPKVMLNKKKRWFSFVIFFSFVKGGCYIYGFMFHSWPHMWRFVFILSVSLFPSVDFFHVPTSKYICIFNLYMKALLAKLHIIGEYYHLIGKWEITCSIPWKRTCDRSQNCLLFLYFQSITFVVVMNWSE